MSTHVAGTMQLIAQKQADVGACDQDCCAITYRWRNKMNITKSAVAVSLAAMGLCGMASNPVQAQEAGETRLVVDLKDASLDDALNMIFKAVGDPTHSIDPAAKTFNIGTYSNMDSPKAWGDIVRKLPHMENFKFFRDPGDGSWRVELRVVPTANPGFPGGFPGGFPNGFPGGGSPSGSPSGMSPNITTFGNRSMSEVRVSPQIAPTRRRTGNTVGGDFHIIQTEHVYAGGIAAMFAGATILTTSDFLLPPSAIGEGGFPIGGLLGERKAYELADTLTTGGGGGGGSGGSGGGR
jgi:hypothetical protein